MAKNKNNRKQAGPQNRAQQNEHAQRSSAEEHEPPMAHTPGSPSEVARGKKQKSFGHN
ncbi:hypothetical protein JK359_22800 [Streptomyces actinomycinicus]|uniref:Uncharacterized protein n=1 Tax=Streptomyces actinomycinicus TaxID=1695166 RepID=A0A937JRQ3_9ACTN|nr:hypothetical protein [Streptomyces actinomycinicus]MBL1084763.1 hypothetical protein [Streptomyces actinomycinicus]